MNRKPINWKIASPKIISDTTFLSNFMSYCSNDLWALGVILYELEYGESPAFTSAELSNPLLEAINNRNQCFKKIDHLPGSISFLILSWDAKSEFKIPNNFEGNKGALIDLANEVAKFRANVKVCHENYENAVRDFNNFFSPTDEFGQIIKRLLTLPHNVTLKVIDNKIFRLKSLASSPNKNVPLTPRNISCSSQVSLINDRVNSTNLHKAFSQNVYANRPKALDQISKANISSSFGVDSYIPIRNSTSSPTTLIFQSLLNVQKELKKAIIENDILAIKKMILNKFDVAHWKDSEGKNLLHIATKNDKYSGPFIMFLIEIGCDLKAKDMEGNTPLHFAAQNENPKVFMTLSQLGADLNALNNSNRSPRNNAEESLQFLDENKLLLASNSNAFNPSYVAWYKNQAVMLEFILSEGISKEAKEKLMLMCLQAYSKAASLAPFQAHEHKIQISPLFPARDRYHRNSSNEFQNALKSAFRDSERINVFPINSPIFIEVLARTFSKSRNLPMINNFNDMQNLEKELNKEPNFQKPLMVNVSNSWDQNFLNNWGNSGLNKHEVYGFNFFKQNDIIKLFIIPPMANELRTMRSKLKNNIDELIAENGFLLSPDQTKEAWIKTIGFDSILKKFSVEGSVLATRGSKFPTVCENFRQLLNTNALKNFKELSNNKNAPPYLQILPEATYLLLEDFQNKSVDNAFREEGLQDLLQITYHKIIDSAALANLYRDNMSAFLSNIDQIHQEIQNILAILSIKQGYQPHKLAESVLQKLTGGESPFIPHDLGKPEVYLKSSAMRCLSSALSNIEVEKGSPNLNVVMHKNSYYESTQLLMSIKSYTLIDILNIKDEKLAISSLPGKKSIDVFICEIHHNLCGNTTEYNKEDITQQLLLLHNMDLLANKCTILIDSTMDLDESKEMRAFYHHAEIRELVKCGKLNIVSFRSTQKYDMLGVDNYYGGISTSINNPEHFKTFNNLMADPQDQLDGLSYQGIAHLQSCLGNTINKYKLAVMDNTRDLHNSIPQKMKAGPNNNNLIQITPNNDENSVFLDIRAKGFRSVPPVIVMALHKMSIQQGILFTYRVSFGFPNTTALMIGDDIVRLNPGLESPDQLKHYKKFLVELQEIVEKILLEVPSDYYEKILVESIKNKWGITTINFS
ncbi:MAG: ankyrin repeat domain-containing protein [Parachlamydiaceae bacterium]|nr:ankyrin repeat domain-containing protein [Parachlamydiaceae bacterium]